MLTDSAYEHTVLVRSEGGLAVVTPLVQVSAWNAQYFWAALASVTRNTPSSWLICPPSRSVTGTRWAP